MGKNEGKEREETIKGGGGKKEKAKISDDCLSVSLYVYHKKKENVFGFQSVSLRFESGKRNYKKRARSFEWKEARKYIHGGDEEKLPRGKYRKAENVQKESKKMIG